MYPLWTGSATVYAFIILIRLGDFEQFGPSLGIDLPHFPTHLGGIFWRWIYGDGMVIMAYVVKSGEGQCLASYTRFVG